MANKLKKENNIFIEQWELVRRLSFYNYYKKKVINVAILMLLIWIINFLTDKDFGLIDFIIYLILIILAPILSWSINEWRFNYITKKRNIK